MELKQEGLQAIIGALAVGLAKTYRENAQQAAATNTNQLLDVDYLLGKIDGALRCQEMYDAIVRCAQGAGLSNPPQAENYFEIASAFASLASNLIASGGPDEKNAAIESLRSIQKNYEQQVETYQKVALSHKNGVLPETLAAIFCRNYAQAASVLYKNIFDELRSQQHNGTGTQSFVVAPTERLADVLHSPDMAKAEGLQYSEFAFMLPDISWQRQIIKIAVNLK